MHLYCLNQMQDKIPEFVRQCLLQINPGPFLERWLQKMRRRHDLYRGLFSEEERLTFFTEYKTYLGIPFQEGAIRHFYEKLITLQDWIRKKPNLTHFSLLEEVEPLLAHRYRKGFENEKDPFKRFKEVEGSFYQQGKTADYETLTHSGHILNAQGIPIRESLWETARKDSSKSLDYRPHQALLELSEIETQHEMVANLGEEELSPLEIASLKLDEDVTVCLKKVNLENVSSRDRETLFKSLEGRRLKEIFLNRATSLTNTWVQKIVNLSFIRSLTLSRGGQLTERIFPSLTQAPHLSYLDLSQIPSLKEVGNPKTFPVFPALKTLILNKSGIRYIYVKASQLKKVVAKTCESLQALAFPESSLLGEVDLSHNLRLDLGSLLQVVVHHPALSLLHLEGCQNKVKKIASRVKDVYQKARPILNLEESQVGDKEIASLAPILPRLKGLTTLQLRYNKIGPQGAQTLAKNTTLTTLDLGFNKIQDKGAQALAKNTTLATLDLRSNQIGDLGAKAFETNQTLTSLNLKSNHIGDTGAQALARNTTLRTLHLPSNEIGPLGAKALATNTTLQALHLWNNIIGVEGLQALIQNTTLLMRDAGWNDSHMNQEVVALIESLQKKNPKRD